MERNLRFKSDRASLIVGSKFTVFALFYFVSEGNWRGDLTEGFLRYEFGGLIQGGAYFRNFTVAEFTSYFRDLSFSLAKNTRWSSKLQM